MKLSGLVVKAVADGQAPRTVKLFTNQPSLGFAEAASEPPTQAFTLSEEDLDGRPLALRRAAALLALAGRAGLGLSSIWQRRAPCRVPPFMQI